MCAETELQKTAWAVRAYRLCKNDLEYRRFLSRLSDDAVHVVFALERGDPIQGIVASLSWQFHRGAGYALTAKDRRAGRVVFWNAIRQIRRVLDVVGQQE